MKRHPRSPGEFIRGLPPLDPDEFRFIFAAAQAAGSLRTPVENPAQHSVQVVDGDHIKGYRFTDNPLSRATFAIKEHCGEDRGKFMSASMRLFALGSIIRSEQCAPYRSPASATAPPEDELLHESILDVAATMPLNGSDDGWDIAEFFARVRELVAAKYPGEVDPR